MFYSIGSICSEVVFCLNVPSTCIAFRFWFVWLLSVFQVCCFFSLSSFLLHTHNNATTKKKRKNKKLKEKKEEILFCSSRVMFCCLHFSFYVRFIFLGRKYKRKRIKKKKKPHPKEKFFVKFFILSKK